MSRQGLSELEHRQLIQRYLKNEFGVEHSDELYAEQGCIPMHSVLETSPSSKICLIGARGGLVRPSTGYAFSAIHEFSEKLAVKLSTGERGKNLDPPEAPDIFSKKAKLLDSVLLKHLLHKPFDGPLLLSSLFQNVECDSLIRFLCDSSSLEDDAMIFASMPRKLEMGLLMVQEMSLSK